MMLLGWPERVEIPIGKNQMGPVKILEFYLYLLTKHQQQKMPFLKIA